MPVDVIALGDDADTKYYVLDFDAGGYLRRNGPDTLKEAKEQLLKGDYTDVVFLSHGWFTLRRPSNNGFLLYDDVVPALQKAKPEGARTLYVAVYWPSHPMDLFVRGEGDGRMALKRFLELLRQSVEAAEIAVPLVTGGRSLPADAAAAEAAKPDAVVSLEKVEGELDDFLAEDDDADSIPDTLRAGVVDLVNDVALQSAGDLGEHEKFEMVDANIVDQKFRRSPAVASRVVRTAKRAWRLLYVLQDLLFGRFERRAMMIGGRGVHKAIAEMMEEAEKKKTDNKVRFSVFGHSLGCHVMLSGAVGWDSNNLPRKLHTMFLAQGACERKVLEQGGKYRPLVSQLRPVAGPIICTTNERDPALLAYDVFLPDPLGQYGFFVPRDRRDYSVGDYKVLTFEVQKLDARGLVRIRGSEGDVDLKFNKQHCYSLECLKNGIINGHNDVQDPEIAQLFWAGVNAEVSEADYTVTDQSLLSAKYWLDADVRNETPRRDFWQRCTLV